jgi:hypothetical protein
MYSRVQIGASFLLKRGNVKSAETLTAPDLPLSSYVHTWPDMTKREECQMRDTKRSQAAVLGL